MGTILAGTVLLFTILVALAIGVMAGYSVVVAMIHLMGRRPRTATPTPVLITREAHGAD